MAILWPTPLGVEEYAAAGRAVAVPRLDCPMCEAPMGLWGWYERDVRVDGVRRLVIRRQRCASCGSTHAVLPAFVAHGRLDAVEVIGLALDALGRPRQGACKVAELIDVPHTTVRDWRRRFVARASMLAVGFSRFCVAVGGLAPRLSGNAERVALGSIRTAWHAAHRRFGTSVGGRWRFANAVVGGQLLSTNTDPPWAAA